MKPDALPRLLASPRNGLAQRTVDTILGHEWLRRGDGPGGAVGGERA